MKQEVEILTEDHPTANGRKPETGEQEYCLRFPTEDGKELVVRMGQKGFDSLTQMIFDMLTEAPSYNDGSTNA